MIVVASKTKKNFGQWYCLSPGHTSLGLFAGNDVLFMNLSFFEGITSPKRMAGKNGRKSQSSQNTPKLQLVKEQEVSG